MKTFELLGLMSAKAEVEAARFPEGSWERDALMHQADAYREAQLVEMGIDTESAEPHPHCNIVNRPSPRMLLAKICSSSFFKRTA